jgi:CPA2 family monovalent cation:H+ antiporter-2
VKNAELVDKEPMHSSLLIVGILTIGFTLASLFAYVMQRLRLPSILGYLLAGYVIGPYSPGFVADSQVTEQLAEIGVILMLFGVGLHFKIEDLIRVKHIAIPGAIGQTLVATLFAMGVVHILGWSWDSGLIMGLCIGVASTVVLVRVLTDNHVIHTKKGHIAVGWLVVEDIFTVIVLILLPTLAAFSAGENLSLLSIAKSIFLVLAKFFVLTLLMFTWGQRVIDFLLTNVARMRSQETFTLTIIALVFLVATGSAVIFGTSIALGAFIAGMVIGKTHVRHQAAANALPLKDIFAVIFFLSVGMLFSPTVIATHLQLFTWILAIILIVKPIAALLITLALGCSLNTAITVAVSLAQIGEFSFILAEESMHFKLMPEEGFDILVACALISISLNPILFQLIVFLERLIQKIPYVKYKNKIPKINEESKYISKVLVIGFGPIGKAVAKIVKDAGYQPIIIEQNIDTVTREGSHEILFGDASQTPILEDADIRDATHLLITIPDTAKMIKIIHAARHANPNIQIIARIQFASEENLLKGLNIKYICTEIEALNTFTTLIHKTFDPIKYF